MQQHIVIKAMLGACIRPDRRPRVPLGCRPCGGRGARREAARKSLGGGGAGGAA
jgi:hypothetical protein